jgi:hypothetical protein
LDDWDPDNRFLLQPVSSELLALAREAWEIWLRWVKAYEADPSVGPTHPAIPADRVRHAELAPVIARALEIDPSGTRIAVGDFRKRDSESIRSMSRSELEVRWIPVE